MFIQTDNSLISELAREYKLDSIDKFIVEFFVKCSPAERQKLKDFACELACMVHEKVQGSSQTESCAANEYDDIEEELQSYRRQLEAEKREKTLSVSQNFRLEKKNA